MELSFDDLGPLDEEDGTPTVVGVPAPLPPQRSSAPLDFDNLGPLAPDTSRTDVSVREAVGTNPDQFQKKVDAARKTGVPLAVAEQDDGSLVNTVRTRELVGKLADSPYAQKWFGNPANAKLAHDDIDNLTWTEASARFVYSRAVSTAGFLNRSVDRVTRGLDLYNPTTLAEQGVRRILFGAENAQQFRDEVAARPGLSTAISDVADLLQSSLGLREEDAVATAKLWEEGANVVKGSEELTGYNEEAKQFVTTWEQVKDAPFSNVLPYVVQQGVASVPEMALTLLGPLGFTALVGVQSERIGSERAGNDGRALVTTGDVLTSLPYAISSVFLERLGARGMLGLDDALKEVSVKGVAAAVGKATVKEATTEFGQGVIENVGGSLGTEKGLDVMKAIDEGFAGAVAGGPFGGSIRAVTATVEAGVRGRALKERAEKFRELNARESALRDRDPETWADFQSGLMEDAGVESVRISAEGVDVLLQEIDALPPEQRSLFDVPANLTDGAATGSGAAISPRDFWALPKDTIDKLADHIAFDVNQDTAQEAAEVAELTEMMSSEGFTAEVAAELASVETNTDLFVEIEQSIMQAGGALTADPAAARAAAQQMAAVFTTMAKRTGVPLQKIKDRFLPRIEGATGQPAAAALEQNAKEFGVSAEVLKAELDAVGGDITQTPRFKKWFKQGKLLDAEGKPLALFHRTGADIEAFVPGGPNLPDNYRGDDFGLSGRAVFLSTDPAAPEANFRIGDQGGENVLPVYSSLQNPFYYDPTTSEFAQDVYAEGDPAPGEFPRLISDAAIARLREDGHDGVVVQDADGNISEVLVFDPSQIKSAFNRGAFDPASDNILFQDPPDGGLEQARATVQDPEAIGLTEEEAARVNPIYRAGALPTKRLGSNEKAAKWLEEQFDGEAITDFTATLSTEQLDQLGRMMAAEVQLALESTSNAADWYSGAVLKAITTASIKYPMLTDDAAAADAGFGTSSNAQFAFTYIMAVTSQNLDVSKNSAAADAAFSEMVETVKAGDYSMKAAWGTGDKQAAMAKNFKKFKPMLDAMQGDTPQDRMAALDELFREKKTVKEWVVSMKAAGIPYSPPGNTAMDVVVYGSSTLGPKIGNGFWQNLNGNFDPLTIDLWMRRTWGRLTGKSIGLPSAIPAQRRRLKAAVAKSRSNEQGAPDLIDIARAELDTSRAAQADHTGQAETTNQTKKDFDAETRRLNKAVRDGEALLSDLAGLKAPETWKAEYGKDDDALLAYAKRLLKAWTVEYKSLQKKYDKGSIPDELQPTWARAAKAIRANLSTPLDQITNGTQRKQVEAAGARAIEILSERGIDVTTADMQALLWYPEKELWGALRDKLEVDDNGVPIVTASDLNESYDTAFARIFRSQGYEVEGIEGDGAGGSGQGAVAGQDARLVEPGDIRGAGQAGGAVGRRELFQEVDFVGDVIFEVAPDPNNVELSARWNALPPEAQLAISDVVSKSVLPSVLEAAGAEGSVSPQIGSYLDDTNPSFSLRLTSGAPAAVANAVGFVLSQDSMVALSADAFEGSFEAGAVRIQIGDKSLQEIDGIYQTLRGIEGFPQIGGQSTTDGQMTLILEEGVDVEAFSDAVVSALPSEYTDAVLFNDVNVAFPEKKDYDYGSPENDPAGNAGVARQRYRAVRDQAAQEVAAAIDQYERGGTTAADQQLGSGARGSIEGARPTDVQDIVIRLYKAENLSTFLHESGHLYLKMLGTLATDMSVPRQVKDDFDSVLKFLGVGSEGEIGTAQHEKWAETYEQYLRNGTAPSQELRSAFAKFSAWLTTIYRNIKSIGTGTAALNKDISDVMDRLLATDEQIANVQSEMRMAPIFKDAEAAGMTDEAFAEYKQRYEDARESAHEELVQEAFAETRRERTKWWREELQRETDRVLESMDTDPAWRTRAIIQRGILPSGAPLPEVYPPRMKLNKAATAAYGHDLPGGNQLFARDGVDPERAAQDLGYPSGDQMLYDLSQLPKDENGKFLTATQFADRQAREFMLQEHGDIMNPDEMHEAALMRVHSRRQAQVILDELRLLNRKAGGQDRVTNTAARNAAEQAMSEKTISEIESPTKYLNAERRFSMKAAEAVIAGDIDAALRFKTQQLLNFHMYRTARDMRLKADKMIATLSKRSRQKMDPKKVEPSFITQIKAMVSGLDFSSRMSQNRQALLSSETLQNWADQQSLKYGATFHISPELDRALSKQNIRDFTFSELEGLHDTVKSVYTQGLRYADAQNAQFNSIVQNMGYDIDANAKKKVRSPTGQRTRWEGTKSFVRLAFAEHRHILSLSEELDGYEQNGSVYSNVYQPIKRADDRYIDRSMQAAAAINKILSTYTKGEKLGFLSKKYIPELKGTTNPNLSRNERLAFGLNMGNAGNVAVMKDTYTDAQIDAVMATLTDKDVDVIESIWEQIDSYWPELSALEERTTGVKPAKVEPSPFVLPSGRKVKGGYYPLLADPNADRNSKEQYMSSQTLQAFSSGGKAKVSTKHGSTIERQGFGERPVWLDLRGLFEHIDGVIKDIEMREAVSDVNRVIRSKPFEKAVKDAKGSEFYEMFNNWLENTVGASKPPITTVEKMSQYARTGASIAEMGLSVRTMLMQPFGFTNTVALLGEKYAAKGLAEFIGQRGGSVRKVMEASAFMRNRSATFNRDVREANRWMGVDSLKQDVVNASFRGIQYLDMAVSIPSWLGAYQKALDEGRAHDDAVDFADQTVSRGQGTGLPRDMADISQGPVWKKMFTMFYSYFSAYQNMQTDMWKQTNFKNPAQAMKYAKNQIWVTIIPSIAVDALFNQLFGGDDETLWLRVGGSIAKTLLGGMVFVRDVANVAASGFKFDYQLTPAGNPIKEVGNVAKQLGPSIEDGEMSTPLIKSLIMFAGYAAQLPGARQASRAYSVVSDEDTSFETDEFESWYRVLVTGPKRDN